MIQKILLHYQKTFPFESFYDILLHNISISPEYYNPSKSFLFGYSPKAIETNDAQNILTEVGDIRTDLPVWFGDCIAPKRLVLIGLEPRDTDKTGGLNIERSDKYVFGTPFALERPRGPYFSAFQDLMNNNTSFVYFTDVVKRYYVNNIDNKLSDDKLARKSFLEQAYKSKDFLLKELEIINPTIIIALGSKSYVFLKELLGETLIFKKSGIHLRVEQ